MPDEYKVRMWVNELTQDQAYAVDAWISFQGASVAGWIQRRSKQYENMKYSEPELRAKLDLCEWQNEKLENLYNKYDGIRECCEYWRRIDRPDPKRKR